MGLAEIGQDINVPSGMRRLERGRHDRDHIARVVLKLATLGRRDPQMEVDLPLGAPPVPHVGGYRHDADEVAVKATA